MTLYTSRLVLRPWESRDHVPFATMNADPRVMRYFAAPLTRAQSHEAIERYRSHLEREGFGFYAVEDREHGTFLGTIGGQVMSFAVPGLAQPAVEIGWRLTTAAQGRGLCTEGAKAVVEQVFGLGLERVVAVTIPTNQPSRRVMEKLGMVHRPELSFDHPKVPAGHAYQPHVLYELVRNGRLQSAMTIKEAATLHEEEGD